MSVELTCNHCGNSYSVPPCRKDSSNYCSQDCYWDSKKERVKKVCEWCSEEYEVRKSKKNSKYCSADCKDKSERSGSFLECQNCGDEYYQQPSKISSSKYCSDKCLRESSKTGEKKTCEVCGEKFYVPENRVGSAKFCDKYCKKEYETADYDRGKDSGAWSTFSKKYREWVGECESCGNSDNLHTHHDEPIFKGGDLWNNTFTVLCRECHIGNYSEWH